MKFLVLFSVVFSSGIALAETFVVCASSYREADHSVYGIRKNEDYDQAVTNLNSKLFKMKARSISAPTIAFSPAAEKDSLYPKSVLCVTVTE